METLTREQLEKRVEATLEAEAPKQVAALAVLYLEVLTDYLGQPVVVELPGGTWTFHPTPTHVQKVGWFARIAEEGSGR